jgi:uncharacterized cupredoxin-like copper-binding protein
MFQVRSLGALSLPILAAGLMLVAAACSSPSSQPAQGASPGSGNEVRLVTTEWKFEPGTLQLTAGKPVSLLLDNKGALEHDIMVPAVGVRLHANPRQTSQATVTIDQAGTYDFECSIPGHKESGMTGKLLVQ